MAPKKLSVIVPTYDEVDNVEPLTERLFAATKKAGLEAELVFVDDESKGTAETEAIVARLAAKGHPVSALKIELA